MDVSWVWIALLALGGAVLLIPFVAALAVWALGGRAPRDERTS